jgi:hypothetical protein
MVVACMIALLALLVGWFLWCIGQCNPDDEQD